MSNLNEESRQKLFELIDQAVINFRAVDNDKITPQDRDKMNNRLIDNFLEWIFGRFYE